ncbi:hypothetical protein Rhe02_56230 [Rhizocola hellebori]|uniref:Uncharacterized protein n=1 Tax=Rhizocola hellebori TaxID=1392758 RepID=A0A8J3VIY8_9ACTN|nr:hypothetical protein [Rhizocola hellebori]GIH07556.1 hypothetical protein Rhe02_56230 [Rhizocola hellebori]
MTARYTPPPRDIGGLEIAAALLMVCGGVAIIASRVLDDGTASMVLFIASIVLLLVGLLCAQRAKELERERQEPTDRDGDQPNHP